MVSCRKLDPAWVRSCGWLHMSPFFSQLPAQSDPYRAKHMNPSLRFVVQVGHTEVTKVVWGRCRSDQHSHKCALWNAGGALVASSSWSGITSRDNLVFFRPRNCHGHKFSCYRMVCGLHVDPMGICRSGWWWLSTQNGCPTMQASMEAASHLNLQSDCLKADWTKVCFFANLSFLTCFR